MTVILIAIEPYLFTNSFQALKLLSRPLMGVSLFSWILLHLFTAKGRVQVINSSRQEQYS